MFSQNPLTIIHYFQIKGVVSIPFKATPPLQIGSPWGIYE
jgi:hypothetical protein